MLAQCMYVVALLVLMYFDDFLSVPLVPRFLHILFAFLLKNRSYHMPHLSTAIAWREKICKHFVFYKYFCLILGLLKSRI